MSDKKKYLIINGDGYGFTAGVTQAYDECVALGTVSSLSVNVNFPHADRITALAKQHPHLSIGCHLNPVVGKPVNRPEQVPTLVNQTGDFYYKEFAKRWLKGSMSADEMRLELTAQVEKLVQMVGKQFSHIDFHMGLQRLPKLYSLYLDVVEASGVGRVRTDHYYFGIDDDNPRLRHLRYLMNPVNLAKYIMNYRNRRTALSRGLVSPDRKITIIQMHGNLNRITTDNFIKILKNVPVGYSELVVHPAYVDDELLRWSSLVKPRELMLKVLLDQRFKDALDSSDVELVGYLEIPTKVQAARNR